MPTQPGYYFYSRPSWLCKVRVRVYLEGDELVVRFKEGYYPTTLKDFPVDGIFEPTEAGKLGEE